MKPLLTVLFAAILFPLSFRAEAASLCQVLANNGGFDLLQDGEKRTSHKTVEEALGVLQNMIDNKVCERSTGSSFCAISTWGNGIYVDHILPGYRSKAFESRSAQEAASYITKLEKLGFCSVNTNPGVCSLYVVDRGGGSHYYAVQQHETGREHDPALFARATEAIQYRDGLAAGKGCVVRPQALQCSLSTRSHLLRGDTYVLSIGDTSVEYKNRDKDRALADRDALIAAKACVAPRAAEATSEEANGSTNQAL